MSPIGLPPIIKGSAMTHTITTKIHARTLAAMMHYAPCVNVFHPNVKRRHISEQLHHINATAIQDAKARPNLLHARKDADGQFRITVMPTTSLEFDTQRIATTLALIMCTAPKNHHGTCMWMHALTPHDPLSHALMEYAGDLIAPRDILADGISYTTIDRLAHILYLTPEYTRQRLEFHKLA